MPDIKQEPGAPAGSEEARLDNMNLPSRNGLRFHKQHKEPEEPHPCSKTNFGNKFKTDIPVSPWPDGPPSPGGRSACTRAPTEAATTRTSGPLLG